MCIDYSEQCRGLPNPINWDSSIDEIWGMLEKAAQDLSSGSIRLGILLGQILREKPYKRLRVVNFKDLCCRLGFSDRKGRHLVLLAVAWKDACETLGRELRTPLNFVLAERVFQLRECVSLEVYKDWLVRVYEEQCPSSAMEKELASVARESANTLIKNSFREDLKRIGGFYQLTQIFSVDEVFQRHFAEHLGIFDDETVETMAAKLDHLISAVENRIESLQTPDVKQPDVVPSTPERLEGWARALVVRSGGPNRHQS